MASFKAKTLSNTTREILALLKNGSPNIVARVEGTGGGCTAIVAYLAGNHLTYPEVLITTAEGSDVPDDTDSILLGYTDHENAEPQYVTLAPRRSVQAAAMTRSFLLYR